MSDAASTDAAKGGFNPVVIAALLVVGLAAFVAFFAGQAFDTGPRADLDSRPHAASKSAVGFAGAVQLLKGVGHSVVVARGPVTSPSSVLVITPDGPIDGSIFDEPVVTNHAGPVLVILPKWATIPGARRLNWVYKAGLEPAPVDDWLKITGPDDDEALPKEEPEPQPQRRRNPIEEAMRKAKEAQPDPSRVSLTHGQSGRHALGVMVGDVRVPIAATGPIDRLQTFRYAPNWEPMIVDAQGRAVMIAAPDAELYVLAEPDLLNTHGLASLDNARAATAMLDEVFGPDASYVFDVTLHGIERSRSFLRQAFEPPFLAATLCALATLALMIWHAFVRFGRAVQGGRAFAMGKRALADNQADLIKMTNREHRMGGAYGSLVRDLAARAVGAPRDLTPEALDDLLDRLGEGGRTSWPLSTLRRDIEQARDPAELVKAAERLHQWKLEMTRERQ